MKRKVADSWQIGFPECAGDGRNATDNLREKRQRKKTELI